MANKFKPRKQKAARDLEVMELLTGSYAKKAGPMRDRRERRVKDARRSWKNEEF
jgi:hypothetical protein